MFFVTLRLKVFYSRVVLTFLLTRSKTSSGSELSNPPTLTAKLVWTAVAYHAAETSSFGRGLARLLVFAVVLV